MIIEATPIARDEERERQMVDLDTTCITIVSKSRLFRDGLKSLLGETNFETVCEVEDVHRLPAAGEAAYEEDLILFDAGAKYPNLVEDVRHLTCSSVGVPVVVLADVLEPQLLVDCMGAGAAGYLLKDISPEALVSSLRLVQSGEKVFPTHIDRKSTRLNSSH